MRFYSNCYELMSELGRNLWEMGSIVKPKTYQNKDISGNEDFETKELICEQYCLTSLDKEEYLFIHDKNSMEWVREEFKERVTNPQLGVNWPMYINPGEAYKLRLDIWEDFLVYPSIGAKKFDYTYNERIMQRFFSPDIPGWTKPNLISVIELLEADNDTRKAILPIFTASDVMNNDGKKRIPCSMYYDFLVREINGVPRLNITYHQRSADLVAHFGNDVYLAWRLMEFVANEIGVKPGYLYHTIDSLHSYKRDWQKLKTSIGEI